ncbi:hypothetical protein BN85407740 [Alteracholeplasma palmae J233]|uniref:Uncharacterized protein n=1 Tax=Alteracholeplasma palmae (strain ATCC 49389 / J233) TaxID=1318466 RepID=U4KRP4_ALTPJ|nr:hypothetical protein [Alteracholeplasma palmae]CCV64351.1 hypothetical protein BN85407740 [Alteracholeplasma palmae J233]
MKTFKKSPVLAIIAGIVLIVLATLYALEITNVFTVKGFSFASFMSGILILVLAYFLVLPEFRRRKGNARVILAIELVIFALVSLLGFILPSMDIHVLSNNFSSANWIAIILLSHGLVSLYISQYTATKTTMLNFTVYIILYGVGAYLLGSNSINLEIFNWIIVGVIGAIGIYLLGLGLLNTKKK